MISTHTCAKLAFFYLFLLVLISACDNTDDDPNADFNRRLEEQRAQIETIIAENNINAVPTNGYYLEVLSENPSGEEPELNDALAVYYQMETLDGNPIAELSATAGDVPDIVPFNRDRIVAPLALYDVLAGMRTGEEVRVYMPFNTAYGAYGITDLLPAYSFVILKIRLEEVLTPAALKQRQDARIKKYLADNNLLPADSLEGGVYYHQLEAGQAPEVKPESEIQIRYTGRMLGGFVFDSNVGSTTPLPAKLSEDSFVPGFETALLAMSQNERGITVFPADQGYGPDFYAMPDTVSNDFLSRNLRVGNNRFFGAYKPLRFDLSVESVN